MMDHPGWQDAKAIMDGIREEVSDELSHMLNSAPDQLTGKKAHNLSGQVKALSRFEEELMQAPRILLPNRKAGGSGRAKP